MAEFHSVGPVVTITPGATHYWEYWFGRGADVGAAVATPNLLRAQIETELVALQPGVIEHDAGEGAPAIHYTVRIHNNGAAAMEYNLNLGNFK
jgi:hypothetical protein